MHASSTAATAAARILLVEDDPSLNEIVRSCLDLHGYTCAAAFSGTEARLLLDAASGPFDLVLCDLMLPGMSGEDVVAHVRASKAHADVPVVVISAKGLVDDRVSLLRSGADDYLVKPFSLEELMARIEVQLRRARTLRREPGGPAPADGALSFGPWRADEADRTFTVAGAPVRLTRTEFDIVCLLMRNPGRVFSKSQLLEVTNSGSKLGEEKTAATHVGNIRAKLKGTGTEGYLQTVWGIGFRLALP